ncbi:MAG: hypothetical protein JNK64_05040 [Myxococcales bacterium]|nr:hypothetical protein [Myxococcales bacterium]
MSARRGAAVAAHRWRIAGLALAVAGALAAPAGAQPGPDAGVDLDGGVAVGGAPSDGGVTGDAGPTRIVIDGPTLLGIGKPQVSASASPTEMRLGDKFTLFVDVVFDENVTVSVPSGLDLAPSFDELKRTSVEERRSDGTRKRTYQIQLQAWELGDVRLPPVQVTYSVGGDSSWVVTNEVPLRIVGSIDSIDDPNAFLGATPPVPLRRRNWLWLSLAIGVAVMAVVGGATWLWSRRRRKARAAARPVEATSDGLEPLVVLAAPATVAAAPPAMKVAPKAPARRAAWIDLSRLTDAARKALAALDELERAGTLVDDQVAGYRVMAGIVRTYLLEEFALPSRHRTTRELIKALGATPIAPSGLTEAERWLGAADLVKFAAAVDPEQGAIALADARALITAIAGARGGAR